MLLAIRKGDMSENSIEIRDATDGCGAGCITAVRTWLGQAVLLIACIDYCDYSMVRRRDRCRRCGGEAVVRQSLGGPRSGRGANSE
jgi:hypothetical protein